MVSRAATYVGQSILDNYDVQLLTTVSEHAECLSQLIVGDIAEFKGTSIFLISDTTKPR